MTTTVRLNVGGVKFVVERSLIELHPDTMLARMIRNPWNQNFGEQGEIFIDRNGVLRQP